MKKYLLIISITMVFGMIGFYLGGRHVGYEIDRVTTIVAIDPLTGQELSRGVGYYLDDTTIITSAHVVPDDRYIYKGIYERKEITFTVGSRLISRDIAILSPHGTASQKDMKDIISLSGIRVGDSVFVSVFRSGSIVQLSAKIENTNAQILAYDKNGEMKIFSGIILADIPFLPGDSGAPIFTEDGKFIDVVHVR